MKKIVLGAFLMTGALFAEVKHIHPTPALVESGIKIIDIRTEPEWQQTGIVKGAVTITFFDAQGNYDAAAFLRELDRHVDKNTEFALICRTGNRTTAVSDFLDKQGYRVINLKGGIRHLIDREGYKPVPYRP
ncbi:MAG: rhodanese-like domain-containing protein [Campylobacterales bacterium]